MPITNTTTNRDYQLPNGANYLSDDVYRIIAALEGIDVDVATLFANLAGKAATTHSHAISDVTGLTAALNAKADSGHSHTTGDISDLSTALNTKADKNSPEFTGTPTAPTQLASDNSTRLATTKFVKDQAYLTSVPDGSVATAKIVDAAVTTAKIADSAVTAVKIADGVVSFVKLATGALATAAEFLSNTASKLLTVSGVWSAAAPVVITDGASVTPNMSSFINATIAKTENGTLENPTNAKPGQAGFILFTQDSAGDKTQAFGTDWKNIGFRTQLQTGDSKKTRCDYSVVSSTEIHYSLTWVP